MITLTVTTSNYTVTAAANNSYALTAVDTVAPVENTTYNLIDADGQLVVDADLIYIVDSEG
jgi:hypothetical protein